MNLPVDQPITEENPYKICFVCLGNICRSPTAEGVFQHLVNERGYQDYFGIDSAGTSAYHLGESPNTNSQRTAEKHGIRLQSKARRLKPFDLEYFNLLLAMDEDNYHNIKSLSHNDTEMKKIGMLRDFDPKPEDGNVPDPYAGGIQGFEKVFQIVSRSCRQLLENLEPHIE